MKTAFVTFAGIAVAALLIGGMILAPHDSPSEVPEHSSHSHSLVKASPPIQISIIPSGNAKAGQEFRFSVTAMVDHDWDDFDVQVTCNGIPVSGDSSYRGTVQNKEAIVLECTIQPDGSEITIVAAARVLSGDSAVLSAQSRLPLFQAQQKASNDVGELKTNSKGEKILDFRQQGK